MTRGTDYKIWARSVPIPKPCRQRSLIVLHSIPKVSMSPLHEGGRCFQADDERHSLPSPGISPLNSDNTLVNKRTSHVSPQMRRLTPGLAHKLTNDTCDISCDRRLHFFLAKTNHRLLRTRQSVITTLQQRLRKPKSRPLLPPKVLTNHAFDGSHPARTW